MDIKAIVYTSNTGYTAEYAKILADKTGLPLYTLKEAKKLEKGSPIIYLGWLMAGSVVDYKKASGLYEIKMVIGSCLGTTGSMTASARKSGNIPKEIPVFTLQGGFDMNKLHGMHKLLMKIVGKAIKKQIMSKAEQNADDKRIVDMLDNGGSAVDEKNLEPVIEMINKVCKAD